MNFPFGDTDLTTTSSILPFSRIRINLPISSLVTRLSLLIFPTSGTGGSSPLTIAPPHTTSSFLSFCSSSINLPILFLVPSLSLFIFPPSGNGGSSPLPIAHPQTASQNTCPSGVSSQLNPHITAWDKSIILTAVSQNSGP